MCLMSDEGVGLGRIIEGGGGGVGEWGWRGYSIILTITKIIILLGNTQRIFEWVLYGESKFYKL